MIATLRDVARAAGVSIKTVSNVVNGYQFITPDTRARVQAAIEELDYRPNIAARNLRRGRTGLIAVAVPYLVNPYFAELAQVLVETAETAGLTVLVDCTGGDKERERRVIDGFSTQLVDGLILCPHGVTPTDFRDRRSRTPLVLLNERRFRSVDSVAIDSGAVTHAAMAHLLGLGRRVIAWVGLESRRHGALPPRLRLEAYRESLEAAGIDYDPGLVVSLSQATDEGVAAGPAIRDLLASRPDVEAVFCYNDRIALGVIRQLALQGVRVPHDIAVIGIDDINAGRLSTPTLSTMAPDKQAIARESIGLLMDRLDGDEGPAHHITVDFELRARESTLGT